MLPGCFHGTFPMRYLFNRKYLGFVALLLAAIPLASQDWPMWGGTIQRNMVSAIKGLPSTWDINSSANIKWKADLGSTSYGNPVIAGGKIFVGTNNDAPRNPEIAGDKGVLMCFRESDGVFLWQAVNDKLAGDLDWPEQGVCSSPAVDGNRLYYVTNRAELV
jgi:outer membrane protein assembly factor BamB